MSTWHLAPSLVALRAEINAAWPNRPTGSDGTIGDDAHAARKSEHNPDNDPDPMPTGAVSAMDITKMSAAGMERIRKALIADPRTWYVIHDGFIWSRTHGFRKQPYSGSNAHRGHLHVSLMQTKRAHDDTSPWGIAKVQGDPKSKPAPEAPKAPLSAPVTIYKGSRGELVKILQRFLGMDRHTTGHFGQLTHAEVRRYQRQQGLEVDGVVGPKTWGRIMRALDLPRSYWGQAE